ncbi:MAG: hypothetical protein AAB262_02095, partial [Elusimicrobiota bacterium]
MSQLLSVATAHDPAAANRVFDNLRARSHADPLISSALDAVKADFGNRGPIVYTAPDEPSKEAVSAVENCQEALNGAMLSVGGLCKYSTVGAAVAAGMLDSIHQQLMTVEGVLSNIAFILLGLLFAMLSGGVGLIIKILFALGMAAWAIYALVPAF